MYVEIFVADLMSLGSCSNCKIKKHISFSNPHTSTSRRPAVAKHVEASKRFHDDRTCNSSLLRGEPVASSRYAEWRGFGDLQT